MKLFLLGTLLLSGGSVAATNETVQDDVTQAYQQVKAMVQKGFRQSMVERVKESGFPYPQETLLEQMTDEQEAIYLTTIDQINAAYDWPNMTDEEIAEALLLVKDELSTLRDEFGIEFEAIKERQGKHWNDDFAPKGQNRSRNQGNRPSQPNGEVDRDCPLDDTVTEEGATT